MHFSLLVISSEHDDLDALMDPYWQDNSDPGIIEFEEDEEGNSTPQPENAGSGGTRRPNGTGGSSAEGLPSG